MNAADAGLRWQAIGAKPKSAFGGINWTEYLGRTDPYLVWTDRVSVKRKEKSKPESETNLSQWVAVLAEFASIDTSVPDLPMIPSHFGFPAAYRFRACLVDPKSIPVLIKQMADAARKNPPPTTGVLRFEFCQPRGVPIDVRNSDLLKFLKDIRPSGLSVMWTNLKNSYGTKWMAPLPAGKSKGQGEMLKGATTLDHKVPPPAGIGQKGPTAEFVQAALKEIVGARSENRRSYFRPETTSDPLVAVIDDGCNFASKRLTDQSGKPIVHGLWHQSDDERVYKRLDSYVVGDNRGWKSALHLNVIGQSLWLSGSINGRRLDGSAEFKSERLGEEAQAHSRTQYRMISNQWSHGSAVVDAVVHGTGMRQGKEPAMNAEGLQFIQLPSSTVEDTSGGSLSCVAIDAIRDAIQQSYITHDPKGVPRKLIVNLSYGTFAGPHDGTSLFERALCELLTQHENLHVVLPAGNSHLARNHAGRWLSPGRTTTLRWKVLPDNPADTFTELWFNTINGAEVTLVPPCGAPLIAVGAGQAQVLVADVPAPPSGDQPAMAAVIFPKEAAQGTRGSMALLALCNTRVSQDSHDSSTLDNLGLFPRDSASAPAGVWEIRIRNAGPEALCFDAWIQRGDAAPGRSRSFGGSGNRQGYFLDAPDPDDDTFTGPDPRGTINGIATATHPSKRLLVVGASRLYDSELSTYSSAGPGRLDDGRCEGPDVVMPADESLALRGILTSGMSSASRVRVSGTSIAAAVCTHELFKFFKKYPQKTACDFVELLFRANTPTTRPMVPAGAPEHAPPVVRGEFNRVDPVAEGMPPGVQCGPAGAC